MTAARPVIIMEIMIQWRQTHRRTGKEEKTMEEVWKARRERVLARWKPRDWSR